MAKKRVARKVDSGGDEPHHGVRDDDVAAAAEAVEQAKATLHHAQHVYEQAREMAAKQMAKTRAATVGDVIDGSLDFVRRHPVAGVFAGGLVGFLFGRLKNRNTSRRRS